MNTSIENDIYDWSDHRSRAPVAENALANIPVSASEEAC
jgi:hypothetical protein